MSKKNAVDLKSVGIGEDLPEMNFSPISRTTLALFAGGSGDHNPMHIDSDFAGMFGFEDVFAHGMLSMAYLGQFVTRLAPQEKIKNWHVRFTSITPVKAAVTCSGKVVEKMDVDGQPCVKVELHAKTDQGAETLSGHAVIAI